MKSSTKRGHTRHTSEGSSYNFTGDGKGNANGNGASGASTASPSLPMTRLDINEPPMPHPNRLIPQSPSNANANAAPTSSSSHNNSSIPSSPALSEKSISDTLITNSNVHLTRISSPAHLSSLPPEFRTNDPHRPLLHVDEAGNEYKYYLQPMKQAVFFILLVEMLERFSFYGINYTTTAYLTGE